ncbi:hypothetical protein F7725_008879 [Dissostichus mawsoni]|uniref:Uncharacterized protein n=1 Tax=Dissostichus mawsoni TaxID=36200 RepID=A0A7J5Z5X9_DISMA|nr:hypothetical protein F7725_008879 [Dissostichus mawsoni]
MMDSGSWFIIWAMWRRTSFLVMMPRRRLNTKGTREPVVVGVFDERLHVLHGGAVLREHGQGGSFLRGRITLCQRAVGELVPHVQASATHLLVTAAAMRGTMYSRPPAGGGPHHGVEPRGDAVRSGPAPVLEDDPVVVVVRHLLHGDPHDPSCYGADRHAGNEQTRGDLEGTKNPSKGSKMGFLFISGGEDGDDDLEDECEGELPQRGVDPGARRPVGDVVHRPAHSCEDSSAPQSLNSSEISSLVLRRVYGLGKASRAVIPVTAITSSTGYFPSCVVFLRRHQAMLARMNSVPQRPPNTPSRMKGTNSAMYHGVWYST